MERAYREATFTVGVTVDEHDEVGVREAQVVFPTRTRIRDTAPAEPDPGPALVGAGLQELLLNPQVLWADVAVNIRRTHLPPMKKRHQVEAEALLRGESRRDAALAWSAQRRTRAAGLVADLRTRITAVGGEVFAEELRVGRIEGSMPTDLLRALLDEPQVNSIALIQEISEPTLDVTPAGHWTNVYGFNTHGVEIADLNQTQQFYDAGFTGAGVKLGMVESDQLYRDHPGFEDASGNRRVENQRWNGAWWVDDNPNPGNPHGTSVASLIVGDITAGQDASITSTWQRRMRSGVAREATLKAFDSMVIGGLSNVARIVDELADPANDIVAVNMSEGDTGVDPLCEGRDTSVLNTHANELFESDVLLIKSASNQSWENPDDCRVSAPGAAIGSFTVAAYDVTEDGATTPMRLRTSRGGTAQEGRGRSIMGVSTNTMFRWSYTHRTDCGYLYGRAGEDPTCNNPSLPFPNTSGAVPIVTGSLALWESWFWTDYGWLDAGSRHAQLLLQGDRLAEGDWVPGTTDPGGMTGTPGYFEPNHFETVGFDGLWGAGRLRLRRWNGAGLDGPARWMRGSTCVDDGEFVVIPVTNTATNSDVDIAKAVAYTYDSRHDSTTTPPPSPTTAWISGSGTPTAA